MFDLIPRKKKQDKIKTILRIITDVVVIGVIFIILGLLNKNFLFFSDTIHYSYSYPENEKAITPFEPLTPHSFISNGGETGYVIDQQYIHNNNTEFKIKLPADTAHDYKNADVEFRFEPNDVSEVNLGIKNKTTGAYDYQPLFNRYIEETTWEKIVSNGLALYQREKVYDTFDQFAESPPALEYEMVRPDPYSEERRVRHFTISEFNSQYDQSPIIEKNIDKTLTGSSETPWFEGKFSAYTFTSTAAQLQLTVQKIDHNFYQGSDPLEIKVYDYNDNLIRFEVISDDNDISDLALLGPEQTKTINVNSLPNKRYKIELNTVDAYVKLKVNQPYLVVENRIIIQDDRFNPNFDPITIYTDSHILRFLTWHITETNQTVTINNTIPFTLDNSRAASEFVEYELEPHDDVEDLYSIQLSKNHIGLRNGDFGFVRYFSFSRNSFFNPTPLKMKKFVPENDFDESSTIDLLLTRYTYTEKKGDEIISTISFDLTKTDFVQKKNELHFSIKAPGIQENKQNVKIKSISIRLHK